MTTWRYIGCELNQMPKELISNEQLSSQQIKDLLESMPLIEGTVKAATVDALTSLLLSDNIYPLKIHPLDSDESSINRLKRLQNLARQQLIKNKKQKPN